MHLTAPATLGADKQGTVQATITNYGPGAVDNSAVTLSTPSGWTSQPSSPVALSDLAEGKSVSTSWTVTAPCAGGSLDPATLMAKTSFGYGSPVEQGNAVGSATVTRGQPFSVTSPTNLAPGTTTTVRTDLVNACGSPLSNASVSLTAPIGWTVLATSPSSFGTVAAGQTAETTWSVTVAPNVQTGSAQLNAAATYTGPSGPGSWHTSKPIFVPGTVSVTLGPQNQGNGLSQLDFNYPGDGATQPVTVNDARFANSENDGSDFRFNTDTSLTLHSTAVTISSNG